MDTALVLVPSSSGSCTLTSILLFVFLSRVLSGNEERCVHLGFGFTRHLWSSLFVHGVLLARPQG